MHRTRPAGRGSPECRGHELWDPPPVKDHPGTLTHRGGHGHLVDLLKGGHAFLRQLSTPSHEHHRAFRGVDSWKGRDGVGVTGASCKHAHRGASGDPGVAVGHMQCCPFVPCSDELHPFICSGVHQGEDGIPHDRKDLFYPLQL